MAFMLTLKRSLYLREEAKHICRSFSSISSNLRANGDTSPYASMLQNLAEPPLRSRETQRPRSYNPEPLKNTVNSLRFNVPRKKQVNPQIWTPSTESTEVELERKQRALALERMHHRNWKEGDVYAPHDLSKEEMRKWRTRNVRGKDVFDSLNINPLHEWKNFAMMYEFMTPMGRIRHSRETGLRNVNQRRVAKAIRRAIGMGFLPSVHEHPEILRRRQKEEEPLMRLEGDERP
ncbi:hypothetical protein MMC14_004855 [Varicellaria rhodocarpa]|nr:hypothetical protein [Varicellaria rhodocarpa]